MKLFRKTLLKSELAEAMEISSRKLTRILSEEEEEIKKLFPPYNKRQNILFPKVINYITQKYGFDADEITDFFVSKSRKESREI